MTENQDFKIKALLARGVRIPNPASLEIGPEVDPARIGEGVCLHAGCRIFGAGTFIGRGARLGYEAPVTVDDCQIGPDARLNGGFFKDAVLLAGAACGSGAHVRAGTILEEEASIAHTVGLKQTILFPFVTLGSLINFCDLLMAGGTGRKHHSEVGSSYIHFNFTPNQDKATPSLIGDVPRGVMLRENPIFLGGQGGLVGPCRLAYGTVVAAGTICRKDQLTPDRLIFDAKAKPFSIPFEPGIYRAVKRPFQNNILFLANLIALRAWYAHVRTRFVGNPFPQPLLDGLLAKWELAFAERVKRLAELAEKMKVSAARYREVSGEKASEALLGQKAALVDQMDRIRDALTAMKGAEGDKGLRDGFLARLEAVRQEGNGGYIETVKRLDADTAADGSAWLAGIVDRIGSEIGRLVPGLWDDRKGV